MFSIRQHQKRPKVHTPRKVVQQFRARLLKRLKAERKEQGTFERLIQSLNLYLMRTRLKFPDAEFLVTDGTLSVVAGGSLGRPRELSSGQVMALNNGRVARVSEGEKLGEIPEKIKVFWRDPEKGQFVEWRGEGE